MRSIKHIALGTVLTLSVFAAVLYTSCQKDGCKGVSCLNGSTCGGGICSCLPGIGGNNCEIIYRNLYDSTYAGTVTYKSTAVDSTYPIGTDTGNTLVFSHLNDSIYYQMQMTWNRPGRSGGTATVVLSNNTATGSTITVQPFIVDTFTCTGTGSINSNTVSLNLVATPPNSAPVTITFNNFSVQ